MHLSTELSTGSVDKKIGFKKFTQKCQEKKVFFCFFIENPKKIWTLIVIEKKYNLVSSWSIFELYYEEVAATWNGIIND